MESRVTLTPAQLPEYLLTMALRRPVMIWGPPGVGKTALVQAFADSLGLPLVSLLGSQLAAEDLIGVPQIVDDGTGPARSRFCPPEMIARSEPYLLFLDELNSAGVGADVQTAMFSLIHEHRVGSYHMPEGSIVVAAGNRATDSALVRPMPSPLVNRMAHIHLTASPADWLAWAAAEGLHPFVLDYIRHRPDHLSSPAPKTEETFSTPRSWHMLSDLLLSAGEASEDTLRVLAFSCLTPTHASSFLAFVKAQTRHLDLDAILASKKPLPRDTQDRDLLYFLAHSLSARLSRTLPEEKAALSPAQKDLAHHAKRLITEMADTSLEIAQQVIAPAEDGTPSLPEWFLVEVVRDLPRLATRR